MIRYVLKKLGGKKGFSLIEMLVAMAIFVIFTAMIMTSYISVVRAMRDAEEYRILYSDARHVFDVLTENAREKTIYNPSPSSSRLVQKLQASSSSVVFYSYDGNSNVRFEFRDGVGKIVMIENNQEKSLHSEEVKVKSFMVYVWPLENPFSGDIFNSDGTINYSLLFHPRVTFSAVFEKENSKGEVYTLPLQTSVSLRNYN